MDSRLSRNQKDLRKVNKKIRRHKARNSWAMEEITELNRQSDALGKEVLLEQERVEAISAKKENEKKMTDDDWIDHFRIDQDEIHQDIDSHIIPNNRETRLHRKRVIQGLQEHRAEQYMRQQIMARFSIINGIKEKLMEEKNTITS